MGVLKVSIDKLEFILNCRMCIIENICRCTGYVKIEEAILMAAEIIRENKDISEVSCKGLIGDKLGRVDAEEKTLGTGEYVDDLKVEGMVYGVALRSKYPRALVRSNKDCSLEIKRSS